MGLTAPYSLRRVVALGQWDEKQGVREQGTEGAEHMSGTVGALPGGV